MKKDLISLGAALVLLFAVPAAKAAPYVLENDGQTYEISPITGPYTAEQYYGWHTFNEGGVLHGAGDPLFDPQQRTGYIWLFETADGDLQLGIRLGDPGGGTGFYSFDFAGVPLGATTLVADEGPGYIQPGYSPETGTGFADFAWVRNGADGMVAGGLSGLEEMTITIAGQPHHPSFLANYEAFYGQGIHGIDQWFFLTSSGDPLHPNMVALNFNAAGESLRISAVPEPGTLALLGAGLLSACCRRKRA